MKKSAGSRNGKVIFGLADPLPVSGKTMGYVNIPHSRNDSAYGQIAAPITVIANGDGPTVLLLAGTQGDEFEGQIVLSRLAAQTSPELISGRLIIFPMANVPAAEAGLRNSPIDGLNMNRIYPGDIRGKVTEIAANYIERALMPEADFVIDLHSGGASLEYTPSAAIMDHADVNERMRRLALAVAFDAPSILYWKVNEDRTSSGAARRAGTVRMATEIGGGARVTNALVATSYDGVRNILEWAGVLPYQKKKREQLPNVYVVEAERDYIYSQAYGIFEPLVSLGDQVVEGEVVGYIHSPSIPGSLPEKINAHVSGVVVSLRVLAKTGRGDCVMQIGHPPQPSLLAEIREAQNFTWVSDIYKRRRPRVRKQPLRNNNET